MDENERKEFMFKEVDIIQATIKRLANNSFLIKGWMITIVVVTLLLKGTNLSFLAFIPLVVFWGLDAYFLRYERMYRRLYEWVVENRLSSDENLLDMDATRFKKNVEPIKGIIFSRTLGSLYGGILGLIIIYESVIFYCSIDDM